MTQILIIDAGKTFGHSKGELNHTLTQVAARHLQDRGHSVSVTVLEEGYNLSEEVDKYLVADTIIYQMPGWWMGEPWTMKKYIDEVFTSGHGILYTSDGRTRADRSKKYGSGGLMQNQRYMLSLTWNAPLESFTDPQQFFEGAGVDGVYLHFHKANQFLGMTGLPTFICNDVIKQPDVLRDMARYQQHLDNLFV